MHAQGGTYICVLCGRRTRQTSDHGAEADLRMCLPCFERDCEANRLSDHGLDVEAGLAEWDREHPDRRKPAPVEGA
jgi:hypothetical protein